MVKIYKVKMYWNLEGVVLYAKIIIIQDSY